MALVAPDNMDRTVRAGFDELTCMCGNVRRIKEEDERDAAERTQYKEESILDEISYLYSCHFSCCREWVDGWIVIVLVMVEDTTVDASFTAAGQSNNNLESLVISSDFFTIRSIQKRKGGRR
jgi:hypothetical protein